MARTKIEKNIYYDDQKKLYYVNMDYGKDTTGKRNQVQKTFHTKKEAQLALAKFKATRESAVIPCRETLAEYCTYWLNTEKRELGATTRYGYRNIIENHIIPHMGKLALKDVSRARINEYLAAVSKELSPNTVRKHYDLLNSVFLTAVQEEKVGKNPLTTIKPPKKGEVEYKVYNADQLNKLFELVKGDRLEIAVGLAARLGLRRGEICGLRWEHIDLDAQTLYICETRTQAGNSYITKEPKSSGSVRTLKIPAELLTLLGETKKAQEEDKQFHEDEYQDNGYVFAWPDGRPYRPNYLSDMFTDFLKKKKLPRIRFHDLRHSFASLAVEHADVYDVSRALGHSNTRITEDIYIHDNKKCKTAAVEAVSKALSA